MEKVKEKIAYYGMVSLWVILFVLILYNMLFGGSCYHASMDPSFWKC